MLRKPRADVITIIPRNIDVQVFLKCTCNACIRTTVRCWRSRRLVRCTACNGAFRYPDGELIGQEEETGEDRKGVTIPHY